MNFESARAAIYARLVAGFTAAHPAIPVDYENRELVDLQTQTAPFVSCDVLFTDSQTASLGPTPLIRFFGAIHLAVWCKGGQGTKDALTWLDELSVSFKTATFSGVNTQAPRPIPARRQQDWYVTTIRVPFWFDQQ